MNWRSIIYFCCCCDDVLATKMNSTISFNFSFFLITQITEGKSWTGLQKEEKSAQTHFLQLYNQS